MLKRKFLKTISIFLPVFLMLMPVKTLAAKSIFLYGQNAVEVDRIMKIELRISTDGEKVGAVSVDINFPTELVEGLQPEAGGSFCNMWVNQTPNKLTCGVTGNQGFTGDGLIGTLVFRGRLAGYANITLSNISVTFGPNVITGIEQNEMEIAVYGEGQGPTPTPKIIHTPTPLPSLAATPPSSTLSTGATPPSGPGESFGSSQSVEGSTGAQPEDPIKVEEQKPPSEFSISENQIGEGDQALVKDFFSDNQKALIGFFPTIILLALVIHLGIKLYFTEKRRKLELEKLFEDQLGALSSLESKLDLLDQKGEGGRERFVQEFQDAKTQILAEANPAFQNPGVAAPTGQAPAQN